MEVFLPQGKTRIMGILNLTPDSFSDGGEYLNVEAAVRRALEVEAQGADILDLGPQSTRPGHTPVPPEEEMRRLLPALEAIACRLRIPISVDTFDPAVAAAALDRGARIINDVSGQVSEAMGKVILDRGGGWVLMHAGGGADQLGTYEPDAHTAVRDFLAGATEKATAMGFRREDLCADPGIGFGKNRADDLRLLRNVASLRPDGVAVLVGASRKRLITAAAGDCPPKERLAGTIAAHTAAQLAGANILRVHDVPEAVQAARLIDAMLER
ncbi:MAG: dihydropteroate synthase [Oscillospiraceae bacterium]|jgi:dihydropteroate synthase|nr:dihydropteroate synthase [Oscillospiraceae bacterium]